MGRRWGKGIGGEVERYRGLEGESYLVIKVKGERMGKIRLKKYEVEEVEEYIRGYKGEVEFYLIGEREPMVRLRISG